MRIRDKNGDRERIEEYIRMERRREMGIVTMYLSDGGFFFIGYRGPHRMSDRKGPHILVVLDLAGYGKRVQQV